MNCSFFTHLFIPASSTSRKRETFLSLYKICIDNNFFTFSSCSKHLAIVEKCEWIGNDGKDPMMKLQEILKK